MTNAFTCLKNLGNRLVKGLNKEGEAGFSRDFDELYGAGWGLSTTPDLAKFAKAQFNPNDHALEMT